MNVKKANASKGRKKGRAKERRALTIGSAKAARKRITEPSSVDGSAGTRALSDIKPRVGAPTRGLDPGHVIDLAESIRAIGLIEPLAIDAGDHLLAGAHRLAACWILAVGKSERLDKFIEIYQAFSQSSDPPARGSWGERMDDLPLGASELRPDQIPVRIFAIHSGENPQQALAVEVAENEKRRDYTKAEVRSLYTRLVDAGYHGGMGRPKKGQKKALPELVSIIGKSERTVRSMLKDSSKVGSTADFLETTDRKRLKSAALRYLKRHDHDIPEHRVEAIVKMIESLD